MTESQLSFSRKKKEGEDRLHVKKEIEKHKTYLFTNNQKLLFDLHTFENWCAPQNKWCFKLIKLSKKKWAYFIRKPWKKYIFESTARLAVILIAFALIWFKKNWFLLRHKNLFFVQFFHILRKIVPVLVSKLFQQMFCSVLNSD